MAAVFSYNGTDTVSVTFDSVPGTDYVLTCGDPDSTEQTVNAAGLTTVLTVNDVGGLGPAEKFGVTLAEGTSLFTAGDFVAATVFRLGSTAETGLDVTWAFDGNDTVSATFTGEAGVEYDLVTFDKVQGFYSVSDIGTGAPMTITQVRGAAFGGDFFLAAIEPEPNFLVAANRLFTGGEASVGFAGSPSGGGGGGTGDPCVRPGQRFFEAPVWRTIVTNLNTETITFLDRLAFDRTITPILNQPLVMTGAVPSDSPEVNIIYDGDDDPKDPFLEEGNRLLYMFRRECGDKLYKIRGSGIIMQLEDSSQDGEDGVSRYTAYDPWKYLEKRPIYNGSAELPGPDGLAYAATRGDVIVKNLLDNAIAVDGAVYIDYTSGFYGGTIEMTDAIDITFQQGLSVGEAFAQLVATGTLDIVLTPVYDPVNRPGILCELNVYVRAGSNKYDAVFAWDKPSRSLVGVSRLRDGTQRANVVQFYAGQGGPPVTPFSDAASIARFGRYYAQQFFPGQNVEAAVEAMAQAQMLMRRNGLTTFTMDAASERSPQPFVDYYLGDVCPVWASDRLRKTINGDLYPHRVHAIPISLSDDGTETVGQLLTSPEEP